MSKLQPVNDALKDLLHRHREQNYNITYSDLAKISSQLDEALTDKIVDKVDKVDKVDDKKCGGNCASCRCA